MNVIRYASADAFLAAAEPVLMMAEAENNLIIGVTRGLARNAPSPEASARQVLSGNNPYLATSGEDERVLACGVYIAPFKLMITRANREPIAALASDEFTVAPGLEGVSGPDRSAADFAAAWSKLSGVPPRVGMRLRIHETRGVTDSGLGRPPGRLRKAMDDDLARLCAWTETFVAEAKLPEKVDARAVVAGGIKSGRLHVWDDEGPASMAAWAGKTPSGVRLNFVYTPPELRGQGYATACVRALTGQQLEKGNSRLERELAKR